MKLNVKTNKTMKSFNKIVNQNPVFMNGFSSAESVFSAFQYTPEINPNTGRPNIRILFANYEQADYEGWAFVLYAYKGHLYEVNGSHCSCYGLEDQWNPEKVVLLELQNRLAKGTFGERNSVLAKFLGVKRIRKNENTN